MPIEPVLSCKRSIHRPGSRWAEVVIQLQGAGASWGCRWEVEDVVVLAPGDRAVGEVRQGENFSSATPFGFRRLAGIMLPGNGRLLLGVAHDDDAVVEVDGLRKIALPLEFRGHGHAAGGRLWWARTPGARRRTACAVAVEFAGNVDRAADVVGLRIVAVAPFWNALLVVEEVVGVELLVAFEVGARPWNSRAPLLVTIWMLEPAMRPYSAW